MNDDTPQPWRIVLVSKTGLKWRIRWGGMCEIRGPNASCPPRCRKIKLPFIKTGWRKFSVRYARKQTWHRDEALWKWVLWRTESFEYIGYRVFSPERKKNTCFLPELQKKGIFLTKVSGALPFERFLIVTCNFLINFTWGCSHNNATWCISWLAVLMTEIT